LETNNIKTNNTPERLALDTNILLLDANNLLLLGKNSTIVLAETVLEEMDSKKNLMNELGYQAREFGRLLTNATVTNIGKMNGIITTILDIQGIKAEIVALDEYTQAQKGSDSYNDQKILEVALCKNCTFMTNDVMCKLRGMALGLKVLDFKVVDDTQLEFTKHLDIRDPDVFRTLHNAKILDVDTEYKYENFNYIFTDIGTGQTKLGTVSNGLVSIIGKDTEKDLRRQDANPANSGQLLLSKAIQDPTIDIVVCEAKAGSGKTHVAISNAIRLVKQGRYDSILYIRASVDDVDREEAVGFLSGNDEKFAVYLHPLHDTLHTLVSSRHRDSRRSGRELEEKIEADIVKLMEDCNIQAMTTLGLRGRTFNNTLMILDEAQNQSKASMVKVLTRLGKGSKLILCGSNKQIDNAYINKYTNGLSVLLDACTKSSDLVKLHAVNLDRVVRSAIAEWSEDIFDKGSK